MRGLRDLEMHRFGRVEQRLERTRAFFRRCGDGLAADPELMQALATLRCQANAVAEQMTAMHLGVFCCACASHSGGGCCGASMAEETDELQLLINLLAGVKIRMNAHDDDSCPFLGPRGCQFLYKPMFCLNYLCQSIRFTADSRQLRELERLTGVQLQQQYVVERYLMAWGHGSGSQGKFDDHGGALAYEAGG